MKKLIILIIFVLMAYLAVKMTTDTSQPDVITQANQMIIEDTAISKAYAERISDIQVTGSGTVERLLSDDNKGSRHQRFILRLPAGQTLLVSHNIDIAPRISNLHKGDSISFNGEYEWNERGGVIHWTHHDPDGIHEDGWLIHKGKTYQ